MKIVEKPEDFPRGEVGSSGYYGGDENWKFTVSGLDLCDIEGEIQSWDTAFVQTQLFENAGTPEYDVANITNVE